MSQLTFDGILASKGAMRYKGGLCAEYVVKADGASSVFKFPHGDRIKLRKGPHASRGPLVVIGTTTAADSDIHSLVLHDEKQGGAFVLGNCKDFSEFSAHHDPEPISAVNAVGSSVVEVTGELGHRYSVNTEPTFLDATFGLAAGSKLHFKSLDAVATVAGAFLNVLWVVPAGASRAVPLVGANNEAALLSLHGMRDADANTGATSPRTPRTPGRTRQAPAYTTDLARGIAICAGAFGAKVEVAIDATSLKPFGVKHAQRLIASRGVDAGKTFTVVGVKSGSLFMHIEGDRRVTMCRNCTGVEDIDTMYGFGLGAAKSRSASPVAAKSRSSSPAGGSNSPASPRSIPGAVPKPVWTAHGRVHFDTSAKACEPFGYKHGQTVQATKGGDRGAQFHIVGVRHGTLWAIPDGSSRATAFRHCADKADLDKRYGFRVAGSTGMDRYTSISDEPGKTPMNSPRRMATMNDTPSAPLNFSTPTPVRDPYANQQHQPQQSSSQAPRPAVVPQLPLGQLARSAAQGASSGPAYTVAPDHTSSAIPDVGPSAAVDRSIEPTPFVPGQMPATRVYLKAFAHFKLGHTNSAADPLAFHGYYSRDPQKRLAEAMACLPTFSQHWRQALAEKRAVAFSHATEEEMLGGMRASAHLLN